MKEEVIKLKRIIYIVIIISFIALFISTYIIFLNRTVLKINDRNRYILSCLDDYDIQSSNIKKISFGRHWGNGYLLICYENGNSILSYIYEGEVSKDNLASYIKDNGYSEKEIVIPIIIISLIIIIFLLIYLIHRKNRIIN